MRQSTVTTALAVLGLANAQPSTSYGLSSASGGQFWGIGGISGGGATSRLLFSYPQQQRDEILDYLFKPNFGASIQYLKVEIGGGAQSTEGTEASHMYTPDDLDYTRGYEWQLMVEAKKRNPNIKLGGLSWVWPGWLDEVNQPGRKSPWTNINTTATYVVNWLKGCRDVYNLTIDYMGGWNERGFSAAYFKALRVMLDAEGFQSTQLVCGDDPHAFTCSKTLASDPDLRSIIVANGAHQPQAYDPIGASVGLPMWSTEAHYNIPNGQDWANLMNFLYIDKNVTGYQSWALLAAYDSALAFPDHGLFRAWWPSSGHYELIGRMWVTAHTSQFTSADGNWHYLANKTGAGYLQHGGTYVTLRNVVTGDWSLVIEKQSTDGANVQAETATFSLDSVLSGAAASLQVWRSNINPSRADNDTSAYFIQENSITGKPSSITLTINVGDVITVTTLTTGNKGSFPGPMPDPIPFPLQWNDTFEACAIGQEADSFVSQDGSFICSQDSDGSGNTVMRQMAATWPIQWRPDEQKPHTVGGSALWADTNASIKFKLSGNNDTAMLGVRCFVDINLPNAGPISSEMWLSGAWLAITGAAADGGGWGIYPSYENATNAYAVIQGGKLPVTVNSGEWHTMSIVYAGDTISAAVDGQSLLNRRPVNGLIPSTGYVSLGTGNYGQMVEFDDILVSATY